MKGRFNIENVDLIGAINELKRDKKLKIENQRKIEILKFTTDKEIEYSEVIKINRDIIKNLKKRIQFLKENKNNSESDQVENSNTYQNSNSNNIQKSSDIINNNNKHFSYDEIVDESLKNSYNFVVQDKKPLILPKINTISFRSKNFKKNK